MYKLLEHIASLIEKLVTPRHFFKVKAHTGIIGNERADVFAKSAAVHDNGHDVAIPPPTPDGNPYPHMYCIASDDTAANYTSSNIRLTPYRTLKTRRSIMSEQQTWRCKNRNRILSNWKGLLNSVNQHKSQ